MTSLDMTLIGSLLGTAFSSLGYCVWQTRRLAGIYGKS